MPLIMTVMTRQNTSLHLKGKLLKVNQKLMLDRVGEENVEEKDLISKHFPKITVEAPGYTPW